MAEDPPCQRWKLLMHLCASTSKYSKILMFCLMDSLKQIQHENGHKQLLSVGPREWTISAAEHQLTHPESVWKKTKRNILETDTKCNVKKVYTAATMALPA